jgi:5-methylcytosine-specific restriction protein B
MYRWRELSFLIAALRSLKRQSVPEREALFSDCWHFSEWFSAVPGATGRQLRHILTHLLFPDSFERISSIKDKRSILAAFGGSSEKELSKWDVTSIDKALLDLRHKFESEKKGDIDFYEPEYANTWRGSIRTWLLSWNPTKWEWATLSEDRAKTASGQTSTHQWRCASTGPREGDHVYLVRTGIDPKGIVAFGTVARAPYDAPHHDADKAAAGETVRSIDVEFSSVRDAAQDQIVTLDQLEQAAADQTWNPQSSGIEIKPKAASVLDRLWKALSAGGTAQVEQAKQPQSAEALEPLNLII